jgi:putative aldouronate transport system permease protein
MGEMQMLNRAHTKPSQRSKKATITPLGRHSSVATLWATKRTNGFKEKKKFKININTMQLWSLCAIPVLLVVIFNYLPMVGIMIAFKKYNYTSGIFGSEWTGLNNFKYFMQSNEFFRITWNTLNMNFLFIVFGTLAALMLAILLFELKSRFFTKIFQTVLITPHFLSWVVVAYMTYAILHPNYGFLNNILGMFGIVKIDWYAKPMAWPYILTIASVWKTVGMDSIIYFAALMGVDSSLFEAAEIDGATKWKKIIYIILPSLTNLITILTILKIGNIFRADFGLFYQLPRDVGALYPTTDVVDTYIFRTMRVVGDMGMSSAVGLLQSIVGFVLVIFTNHCAKKIDPDGALF